MAYEAKNVVVEQGAFSKILSKMRDVEKSLADTRDSVFTKVNELVGYSVGVPEEQPSLVHDKPPEKTARPLVVAEEMTGILDTMYARSIKIREQIDRL